MNEEIKHVIIQRLKIETECILSFGYNEFEKLLDLEFNSGYYIYRYIDVPKEEVEHLIQAKNGWYYNKHFRNKYEFIRIPDKTNIDFYFR